MTIYLDTCAIQRPFDEPSQHRIVLEAEAVLGILDMVEKGTVDLLSSEALQLETEKNPDPIRRRFAMEVLELASRTISVDEALEARARRYTNESLRPFDALHLASAVEGRADLFGTTDDDLRRIGQSAPTRETDVLTPIQLIDVIES
jgi:predicted nucleic acid-binding protein